MRKLISITLLSLTLPHQTFAWGELAHRTIAILASRFLLPETATFVTSILPKNEKIDAAAIWPDFFSHQPVGEWSKKLHYIDAEDNPKKGFCGLDYERDCPDDICVVGAIVNVTRQLQPPDLTPLPPPRRPHRPSLDSDVPSTKGDSPHWDTPAQLSLRFLLHFIGDIHQPLHTEGLYNGGNSLSVHFDGHTTNLHTVWDTRIPNALRHGSSPRDSVTWANELHSTITSLPAATLRTWAGSCFQDIEAVVAADPFGKIPLERAHDCAVEWATWANRYICSYVFADGDIDRLRTEDLSGDYTTDAERIVDELVGMAGWRLGAWLNLVVTGKLGLDIGSSQQEQEL